MRRRYKIISKIAVDQFADHLAFNLLNIAFSRNQMTN